MTRNPLDIERRTIAEYKGRVIHKSDPVWPAPEACFTLDIQRRILDKTAVDLCVPHNAQPVFWERTGDRCRMFAHTAQYEASPKPSAAEIDKARHAAERLKVALRPILGPYAATEDFQLLGSLYAFVDALDKGHHKRLTKQKNHAARAFIPDMGGIFAAAFNREPSEAPDGPFARFVLACLDETKGMPDTVSGDWVQKYVRAHKDTASQRSNALWPLGEHLAWDDPT